MFYWYIFTGIAFLIVVIIRLYEASKQPCLRVLMYHKVSDNGNCDYLTIPVSDLEKQFQILLNEEYSPILLSDLVGYIQFGKPLPTKPVLITFDDGYKDNFTIMYPLLKKYGMKAGIFLVPAFIQKDQVETNAPTEYLNVNEINTMDPHLVEYGLHSYDHKSYKTLSADQIDEDIAKSKAFLHALNIDFQPCLAFPYGAFPKKNPLKLKKLFSTLAANNIVLAFRIGNRLNRLPLKNTLLVQRLDIRGDDPIEKFRKLLKSGKGRFI